MSDEKTDGLDSDALAILARRKKLLASAALSLVVSCEVRQEAQAPMQNSTPQTITLTQPEPPKTAPTSVAIEPPASKPATAPVSKPPCLSPPSVCLKIKPPGKKCLSKMKPKICLTKL